MIKKFFKYLKDSFKEEWKFIVLLLLTYIILTSPVNYYIIIGGGISDIDSRIKVEDSYDSKGSFNITFVSELPGTVLTYLLSYVVPDWKRVDANDYKYDETESMEDIQFRSDLDLKVANGTAVRWAYSLADKKYEEINSEIYVIAVDEKYKNDLKVQDRIISIGDKKYNDLNKYREYLQSFDVDDTVDIVVERDNKEKKISAKIYEENDRKIIGVVLKTSKEYETDPKVDINFKASESGPSGGLITTLDIYDKLTKDDLTNSLKIAGTGTIEEDGSIGSIGEVKYKLLGAVSEDADVFLVPMGENYKTCVKVKKEKKLKIKVIGVKNISDAITKLEKLK